MPKVSEIIHVLEELAPPELAEDWDNTGLLIGHRDCDVSRLMTCLTLTQDVAAEAVEQGAELVVTHHPVLFRSTKQITDQSSEGRLLLQLVENQVAVYSPHTSFDSAAAGINQQLGEAFGLIDIRPIRNHSDLPQLGSGRFGSLKQTQQLSEFLQLLTEAVSAEYIEYCGNPASDVSTVAIACGSAAEYLPDAIALGCDTFVTGEAQFHAALQARSQGINLILLGHYSSERPALESLAETLAAALPSTEVWASRVEHDPLTVYRP